MKKSLVLLFVFSIHYSMADLVAASTPFISFNRRPTVRRNLPTNISTISREEIENSGAKSITEILDRVPSINLSRSGSLGSFTTVRLRGALNSGQNMIVVDGQPISGVATQFVDLSMFPIDNIERVEVVRGGSSVLYGANTMGGVVHIITKRQKNEGYEAALGYEGRSHQTKIVRASGGGLHGLFDYYATASATETDGFQDNAHLDEEFGSVRLGKSFSNGARISGELSHVSKDVGTPQGTTVDFSEWDGEKERAALDSTGYSDKEETLGRFQLASPIFGGGTAKANVHIRDINNDGFPNRNADPNTQIDNQVYNGGLHVMFPKGLAFGGDYERDNRQQTIFGTINPKRSVTNAGFYALNDFRFGENLLVTPAVRVDHHGTFGNELNPRLTVIQNVSEGIKLTANAARAFRAPSFQELYLFSPLFNTFGNPDLNPETSWTYDAGAHINAGENRDVKVTGFYTRLRDRIVFDASQMIAYKNGPRAEIVGAEVEIAGSIGPFSDRINYTYTRAKGSSLASSKFVDLALTPKHMVNVTIDYQSPIGLVISNYVQFVSEQYQRDDRAGTKLPAYAVWNFRVRQTIKILELFAGVDNILNRRYAESIGFGGPVPQPDRTYVAGVNVRLGQTQE